MFKNKTFEKENHVILEQTKFTSLATTTISISISLLSQETKKSKPEQKKENPTPSSPVKVSIPVPQFQLKETKIRQLPPPLLTSKKLQTNSLDNMRS